MLAIITARTATLPPIQGAAPAAPQPPPFIPDTALGKIIKLIPTDVVALYVTVLGIAGQAGQAGVAGQASWLMASAFAICIPLIVFILYFDAKDTPVTPPVWQYVFRILSFIAWALAISNPFVAWVTIPTAIPALLVLVLPIVGAPLIK